MFDGRPYDVYDAALTATVSDFPVSIQPFRDMVRAPPLGLALPETSNEDKLPHSPRRAAQQAQPTSWRMMWQL